MIPSNVCAPSDVVSDPPVSLEPVAGLSVAQLLAESRQHQDHRKRLANALKGQQHAPNYAAAEQQAALALRKRLEAHAQDPTHADPAWALDTAPHAEIVAFLTRYAEIP